MTTEEILRLLKGVKPAGDGWMALCPSHDDNDASLSISTGTDGKILLHCHAGCDAEQVCAAIGIKTKDLFPANGRNSKGRIVAAYDYTDENGTLLFQVCRFDPKDFRQRRLDGNGWSWNTKGVRRVPFRLPELLRALADGRPVYVCEGEKDCLAIEKAGFAATCNSGGAGKWQADFANYFRHRPSVIIVSDKDKPGRKHAQRVAENLKPVVASVKVVELPDVNGHTVKDAADFFAAGGTAAELDEISQAAPEWCAPPLVAPVGPDTSDFDKLTANLRGEIIGFVMSKESAATIRKQVCAVVLAALSSTGRLYFHAERRDFQSATFFNTHTKRLLRIRSDEFVAWLSEWLALNRQDSIFRFVQSAVETAALSSTETTGILPEAFWASRPGAIYLSSGDGSMAKITGRETRFVDNGTDGVLFAAGKTLAPWKLTSPRDIFETASLFRDAHTATGHGQDVIKFWVYSLPSNPRSKPPLCLAGEIGSGKTRLVKGIAEFFGLPFIAHKAEESAESDFWPSCDAGGIFILDNADTRCRWLPDAVANAATDGCSQKRKLYTNSETVILRARAWLCITTANPTFASDSGLADRLLPVRMARRDGEITSDAQLTDKILKNRDAGLTHLCTILQIALADVRPVPAGLNKRHPDFADFAVRIGRALGRESEAIAALKAAEADKSAFCLENDNIACALLNYLHGVGTFQGTAAELLPHLVAVDNDLREWLSAKRLGKRLGALWPHLQSTLETAKQTKDRKGYCVYTLTAAEFAEFET